jgi:hypothetical protein
MVSADFRIARRFFRKCRGTVKTQSRSTSRLIGQGIATVWIEDRGWAEFDTGRSGSAFRELADSEPEDGEGPTSESLADGGDLAANGDSNSADEVEEHELNAALSYDFRVSLAER